jgi:hypothetical protein
MPPMRFMASVRVSWASRLRAPCDMAPVENRFTMAEAGSTSSTGTGGPAGTNSSRSCSSVGGRLFTSSAKRSYSSLCPSRMAAWSRWAAFISLRAFTTGSLWVWNSPLFLRAR